VRKLAIWVTAKRRREIEAKRHASKHRKIIRRGHVRPRGRAMEAKMRIYRRRRIVFLAAHPFCAVLPDRRSETIHHQRGKIGPLLLDERFWIATSLEGHRWIDDNKAEARRRGLLCEIGQWNVPVE
jgi:hypothetical protein